jgi:protein-serine/threonine kinase
MTQLFTSSHTSPVPSEKRNFHGLSLSSKKHNNNNVNNNNSNNTDSSTNHFPSKIKNFFRINSSSSNVGTNGNSSDREAKDNNSSNTSLPKNESRSNAKQSRFLPAIGRNRSTTVASEGNPLDDSVSPTAHANPYFAHQGHPALRHRNDGSLPSTPPDVPELQVQGIPAADQATTAGKEELARKLRRVASAPNAQGLFADGQSGERPKTAELGKEPLVAQGGNQAQVGLPDSSDDLAVPGIGPDGKLPLPGQLRIASSGAFRRTYSSNSIKVRNVEVGPGSFDKIKLIGKGDVGKVYLVREKKSNRLYAMKGGLIATFETEKDTDFTNSAEQEGND